MVPLGPVQHFEKLSARARLHTLEQVLRQPTQVALDDIGQAHCSCSIDCQCLTTAHALCAAVEEIDAARPA